MSNWNRENSAQGKKREKGQVTIFFSTTVMVLITFIAFITNIGVFVKAKINLQNATDAAAFAGAAVQARQLTNIAYLNFEMRNIYKEWMFKYYVLGGLNLSGVYGNSTEANSDFTMQSYASNPSLKAVDSYNFPSVCIDFANTGNVGLCTKYLVPGLPRFESSNVMGMDQTTNALLDTLVNEKNKDCSQRTQINFLTANTWAFNVLTDNTNNNISSQAPAIGTNRQGAFPAAFELALRIRNVEAQLNKAPFREGVCRDAGAGVNCAVSIDDELGSNQSLGNERINKAFYSGYRNLGSEGDDLMRDSFTLTEIPPKPYIDSGFGSLSTLLIPQSASAARSKYYVDLKLMTVNLATFFTAFTQSKVKDGSKVAGTTADSEGECTATKMGLPVPGYPLGYVKNPEVLTYYAVEGKSKFIGMFNPFTDSFTLKAYAAAKPFGGRVGPSIFNIKKNSTKLFPRSEGGQRLRSSGYISGLDTSKLVDKNGNNIGASTYKPGAPLPMNMSGSQFWLKDSSSAVGGWVSGQEIFFGIPNLIYDYPSGRPTDPMGTFLATRSVEIINPLAKFSMQAGLYNKEIFKKFKNNLRNLAGSTGPDDILDGILAVRAATMYDAANYLIPTPESLNKDLRLDSYGVIAGEPKRTFKISSSGDFSVYEMELYGPIFSTNNGSDSLFQTPSDVKTILNEYLTTQESAIKKYIGAMNIAAANIYRDNNSGGTSNANLGAAAARILSDIPEPILSNSTDIPALNDAFPQSCASIAGKFAYYYLGNKVPGTFNQASCGFEPISESMATYWSSNQDKLGDYYASEYVIKDGMGKKLLTAYKPGRSRGSPSDDGNHRDVIGEKSINMMRNFYSTKHISLNSLNADGHYGSPTFSQMSEGNNANTAFGEISVTQIKNLPDFGATGIDISSIKH